MDRKDFEKVLRHNDGLAMTVSVRVPVKMLKRLDQYAKETGNRRSDVILAFLIWAEKQHVSERK